MMKTIELKKEKVYCGNLLLVNAEYPLKNNNAESLIPADIRFPDILMKRDAAYVLQLVLEKICAGNSIVPVSGYRSLDEQFDISKRLRTELFLTSLSGNMYSSTDTANIVTS